jgi:hypothetical protein
VRRSRCTIPYIQPSARSYTPMHTCIQYEHACMPCTYTYLHSSAQLSSIYHAHTCPTTRHSCEQAMYCTHLSVWSVELSASAAAICCAPSATMGLSSRLYAHVREKNDTAHVHSSRMRDSIHTIESEVIYTHPCIHVRQHANCQQACMPWTRQSHNAPARVTV